MFAGDRDGAIRLLEKAYREHEGWTIYVPDDPAFAALKNDPRFQQIVQRVHARS